MQDVQHGGRLDSAIAVYGGEKADWLDLSTGINPNAYPIPEIAPDAWHRLPDDGLTQACLAAAREHYEASAGVALIAAPGTQALIQSLTGIVDAKRVWIVGPTYNEYERVFASVSNIVVSAELPSLTEDVDVVVVGNPNNPDGRTVAPDRISALGKSLKPRGGFVVVDEAFGDVLAVGDHPVSSMNDMGGIVSLRSFGKFFGLAGLRLGFAVGDKQVTAKLLASLGPWAVSGPALMIGAEALSDRQWISEARDFLSSQRTRLEGLIAASGFEIVGATDLFVTASHADSANIAKSLAQNHILVRTFDYAPDWIRFGLPAEEDHFDRLEKVLARPA